MVKHRIYDIAKELGKTNKEVIDVLIKHNVSVTSSLSTVDDAARDTVVNTFKKKAPAAPVKPAERATTKPVEKPAERPVVQSKPEPRKETVIQSNQNRPQVGAQAPRPQQGASRPQGQQQRPQGGGYSNGPRPQGGNYSNGPRPQGQQQRQQGGVYVGPRGQQPGQSSGGSQGSVRPQGQQRPQGGSYNNGPRPQGQRQQGGVYVGPRGQQPGQSSSGSGGQQYQQSNSGAQGVQRSQGSYNNGPRPQGGNYNNGPRPQGGNYSNGPRPQGQQNNRPGYQNRPQGQDYRSQQGDNRGSSSYGQNRGGVAQGQGRPQGGYNNGPRPQGGGQRPSGNYNNKPKQEHTDNLSGAMGQGRFETQPRTAPANKNQFNKKRNEKSPIKGSYATKGSRPVHTNTMGRNNKRQNQSGQHQQNTQQVQIVRPSSVQIGDSINVKDFAALIKREVSEVIKSLFLLGVMVTINQDIDFETAVLVGTEFEVEINPLPPEEDPTEIPEIEDDPVKRLPRPPVVTVMGHVDHGKTSLLDVIRKTNVTAREAGGITQHIGAYQVVYQGKKIVFLDTPGHEAFTAMRARGAQVTDVAILVVAADDGVMPQTIEAINHSKAAGVPIIVAINKMDRPGANPDHVKQQLAELELIPEDWGGDTIMVPVSAHQKTGITDLLEMILLVAEMQDMKANPNLPAHGTIIEAQLDKGRGPVATVLIQRGTLQVGDTIIAGSAFGKVRAMTNDHGEKVKKATPSTPVEVLGLNEVPMAGDILDATDEKTARSVAEKRQAKKRSEEIQQPNKVSLDDIFQRIQEGELKELNIVVKADVQGTIEALKSSLQNIKNDEVKVVVVHAGVGAITESDVMLASAANALIIGFNVRPDSNARKVAESEKVDVRTYRVIYDAINDVEAAIKGMLAPKFKETVQGRVEVRQVITISKMLIAGCYVLEGKVTNSSKIRVVRDGIVINEDEIDTLRRFKDDVKEVATGYECGITLEKFRDIKEGDIFEAYTMEEVAVE